MASTYSSNLKIELIATGEQSGVWGNTTNSNFTNVFEQAIVGRGTANFPADADLTLTYTDTVGSQTARNVYLNATSGVSLTQTRNLIVPTINKNYVVQNNTTGGRSIVVKTSAGTGITVPNGATCALYVNGTDVIQAFDYFPTVKFGTGVFDAGTVSAPSITFTGNTNTGIYSPAADTIGFTEGGVEAARFTSTGALQLNNNLTFSGTGNRITGDFSNATIANRVAFQTSTTNTGSNLNLLPNGTAAGAFWNAFGNSDPTNAAFGRFGITGGNEVTIRSDITGTGTYAPLTMYTGGSERLRIDTSGNVLIGTATGTTSFGRTLNLYNDANTGTVASNAYLLVQSVNRNAVIELAGSASSANFVNFSSTPGTSVAGIGSDIANQAIVIRTGGSTERMRIDSAGNLLLGTSTSFTSTNVAGALKMDGYGIYPYLNTSGLTNTAVVSGLTYQNSTPYSGDNGATVSTLVTALVQARLSNSGVGGTNSINIQAGNFGTVISNVGAAARITGIGLVGAGVRNISTDVSTDASNQLFGVQGSVSHGISAGAGIVTGSAIAGQFSVSNLNGTTTTAEGLRAGVNIGNTTSSLSTSSTNAAGIRLPMTVGAASGGPATVTNLFGIITQGPTIGATGTVANFYGLYLDTPGGAGAITTNRFGVFQTDALGANYFAGSVGIGTTAPDTKLSVLGNNVRFTQSTYSAGTTGSGILIDYASTHTRISSYINGFANWGNLILQEGGNVGIGTTSPAAKLHVSNGQIIVNNTDNTSNIYLQNSGTTYFQIRGNTTSALLNNPTAGPMVFATNDIERMRISDIGLVGIGTSSPARILDVAGAAGSGGGEVGIRLTDTTSGQAVQLIRTGATYSYNGIGGTEGVCYSSNVLTLAADNNNIIKFAAGGAERMRITSGGSVLIGKTSNANKSLEIYAASDAALRIQNNTTGTTGVDGLLLEMSGSNVNLFNYENGNIQFGTNSAERMRIDGSGNVLVIQPAGAYTCDVTGGATSVANNGTVDFSNASGMLVVNNHSTGGVTIYIMGGGITGAVSSVVGQVGTMTYVPGINGYRFTNNSGSTATFGFFFVRTRPNA